jgi:hypothetical protein
LIVDKKKSWIESIWCFLVFGFFFFHERSSATTSSRKRKTSVAKPAITDKHDCRERKRREIVIEMPKIDNALVRKRVHATSDDSARANVKCYGVAAPSSNDMPQLVTREVVVPGTVLNCVPLARIAESAGVVIASGSAPDVVSVTGYSCNVVEACAALLPAVAAALLERAERVTRAAAAPRPPSPNAAMRGECVICLSDEALLCCVPCGHLALCERDAVAVAASRQCPVCRASIDNLLRVYRTG